MSDNIEITDVSKGIKDVLILFAKDKLITKRNYIIKQIEVASTEERQKLEIELNEIIVELSKLK